MKLMFCGACGDIVSPGLKDMDPRWCSCCRHAVWWLDGARGILRLHDKTMPERTGAGIAFVLGINNSLLMMPMHMRVTPKDWIEEAINATPDHYVFKREHSMIVRMAPGYTSDTAWEEFLPGTPRCG